MLLIRQQNHHHIGDPDSVVDFHHGQARLAHLVPRGTAFAQANHHLDTAVIEVLCVGMALAAVADDGHGLALDQAQITVLVVKNFHGISPL
jgi:hypothetical protein